MSSDSQERSAEGVGGLEREQLLTDLDQTIGDKEQAVADNTQSLLDSAQQGLDAERLAETEPSPAADVAFDERQDELNRAEARGDAHQAQLDATQAARDDRQYLLTTQQRAANAAPGTVDAPARLPRLAAAARARGVRQRDKAARDRAVEAEERSEAAD